MTSTGDQSAPSGKLNEMRGNDKTHTVYVPAILFMVDGHMDRRSRPRDDTKLPILASRDGFRREAEPPSLVITVTYDWAE
jgi:hypothetical protein